MADFKKAMAILMQLEFAGTETALHKNKTETGYTYMGIYQVAHPAWPGWNFVRSVVQTHPSIKDASVTLYHNQHLTDMVYDFYKSEFWDKAKLDMLTSQHTAEEIFIFGVNAGMKTAVKAAQRLIGSADDGYVGPITIAALNAYPVEQFDKEYDLAEQAYYTAIIARDPKKKLYARGWRNRAVAV